MRRSPSIVIAATLVLAFASVAAADVDLSGSWVVEDDLGNFGGSPSGTSVLTQTGTSLTFDDLTGTIDPSTGIFHVQGAPTAPPVPGYPPGPPPERNGTATSDGMRFRGSLTLYAPTIHFFWVGLSFPTIAARAEVIVCGDGIRDPGEQCDAGAMNGTAGCCDASCALVDPNRTEPCDDGSLALSKVILKSNGPIPGSSSIVVNGTLSGIGVENIAAVSSFRIRDGLGYDRNVDDLGCVRKKNVLQCYGSYKYSQLRITTSKKGTKLNFKMKHADVPSLAEGPVTVSFVDGDGASRIATVTTCADYNAKLTCTP